MKSLLIHMNGNDKIWLDGLITDKSIKSLTRELNLMFRRYHIDKCIQKITFLAQVNAEIGFFTLSREKESAYKSSKSFYKGRGLIQLTGDFNDATKNYDLPGPYEKYGIYLVKNGYLKNGQENIFVTNPELIATDLHYAVDSSGWEWEVYNRVSNWKEGKEDSIEKKNAKKWKRDKFSKGLNRSLNQLSLVIEESGEEETYFWLQSKMLNGYDILDREKPDPHGWTKRKEGLRKVKQWFKYDKEVCKGEKELEFSNEGRAPWLPFAKEELKKYGGVRQINSPLKEKVVEYFKVSKADWYDHTGYWCGAFIRWCFAQTKDYNYVFDSYNSVTAYNWLPREQAQKRNSNINGCNDLEYIDNIENIFVGIIIVFSWSHVAFVIGQSEDEKTIYYLGGNQSDKAPDDGKGKRTICIGKISKSKINIDFWLSKPKKYIPTNEEKQLPKIKVTAYELDYSSTR